MIKIQLEWKGELKEVTAKRMAGKLWFHIDGETHCYETQSALQQGGGAGAVTDPSKIVAAMPGKIIKINRQPGDTVNEGDTIVVMEAMKMEYNLKASQAMKIKSINCQENQTVSLGQVLVDMEDPNA